MGNNARDSVYKDNITDLELSTTPLTNSCRNNDMIQLGPLCSQSLFQFVQISDAYFVHLLLQYRVAQKTAVFLYALTSSNINQFSKLFHWQKQEKTCVIILSLKIPPHLKCVTTLPCEMSSVLKATIENKMTSVTTHFKEINNREQRVYCLSYSLK